MKVKIFPNAYQTYLGVFILTFGIAIILIIYALLIYLGYLDGFISDNIIMAIFSLSAGLSAVIQSLLTGRSVYSIVYITDEKVSASYLGKIWFIAKWDEIVEVGELGYSKYRLGFDGIYLSKTPNVMNQKILKYRFPDHKRFNGNTLFIAIDDEKRKEIFKHFNESQIIHHGECKLK